MWQESSTAWAEPATTCRLLELLLSNRSGTRDMNVSQWYKFTYTMVVTSQCMIRVYGEQVSLHRRRTFMDQLVGTTNQLYVVDVNKLK